VGNHSYKLVQFHFHSPSEERIRGRATPLVAHLVHKDEAGKLAVVAVLIRPGRENAAPQAGVRQHADCHRPRA
jgi:carbonic anhydrase